MNDRLVLTYEEIRSLPDGLRVLQQGIMMRAGMDGEAGMAAAQQAMDIAKIARHVQAEIGSLQRNMEMLLAEYGVREGQGYVLDNANKEKMEAYRKAVENILASQRTMPFEPIALTPLDIQNMSGRPDALAAISPIVTL